MLKKKYGSEKLQEFPKKRLLNQEKELITARCLKISRYLNDAVDLDQIEEFEPWKNFLLSQNLNQVDSEHHRDDGDDEETETEVEQEQPVYVQALYSFVGQNEGELSFEADELLLLIESDHPEWWFGALQSSGARGHFPKDYVQRLSDSQ